MTKTQRHVLTLASAALLVLSASGCQERVVAARGLGSHRTPISAEPAQGPIDRALFGKRESLLKRHRGVKTTTLPSRQLKIQD